MKEDTLTTPMTSKKFILQTAFLVISSTMLIQAEDEKISLDQTPASIQKAAAKLAGSNKILRVEKAHDEGKIEYEILTEKPDGKKIEFILKADGELDSTEERLTKNELPGVVTKTMDQAVGSGEIKAIERITKHGEVSYEVGYKTPQGKKEEAVISAKGKLLKNGEDKD